MKVLVGPWPGLHFRIAMNTAEDTIVAVSSPLGSAARAIVRLSGPEALAAARSIFQTPETIEDTATWRWWAGTIPLAAGGTTAAVPAALWLMRGPHSYTRETIVELHLPGNAAVVEEVVARLCRAGARAAGPGEFTARAFLNGRLDLAQAEAVMAIISAGGGRELAAAQRLLEGRLSNEVRELAGRLRHLAARVELAIDFSEENLPITSAAEVAAEAGAVRDEVVRLSRRAGQAARGDGEVRVALVGRPNVGKSSLFNRLAGAQRALVTPVAGTTRDELRETFLLGGARVVLSDTAGLDEAVADLRRADEIYGSARRKTLAALARADLVLVVAEAGSLIAEETTRSDLGRLLATLAAPAILVLNKCDLAAPDEALAAGKKIAGGVRVVATSALTGLGLDELRSAMAEALQLGEVNRSAEGPAVAARHREGLELASEALGRVAELAAGEFDEELAALELREALEALGGITGETSREEVLAEIFAGFCIGK